MEQIKVVSRLLKPRQVQEALGFRRTKRWDRIAKGTLTPPIRRSERDHVWPEDEIHAIMAADVRGDSEEQLRELCKALVNARKTRAS